MKSKEINYKKYNLHLMINKDDDCYVYLPTLILLKNYHKSEKHQFEKFFIIELFSYSISIQFSKNNTK